MEKIINFVASKILEIIYMFAVVTVLVVIANFLILILHGGSVEDYDFSKAILIIIVCGLMIYFYKRRKGNSKEKGRGTN
jgi:hypothetical protein